MKQMIRKIASAILLITLTLLSACATPNARQPIQGTKAKPKKIDKIFAMGNSLTFDTKPKHYATHYHVFCNKNLKFIYENPQGHCVKTSLPWPKAFKQHQYDVVTVQPFLGTTLSQDVQIISKWIKLQPNAIFIIHTGWSAHLNHLKQFNTQKHHNKMTYNKAYFQDLLAALKKANPNRQIRLNPAFLALELIRKDIQNSASPFKDLKELYRDPIHLNHTDGAYLMHNLMRTTIGLKRSTQGLNKISESKRNYLDSVIDRLN